MMSSSANALDQGAQNLQKQAGNSHEFHYVLNYKHVCES